MNVELPAREDTWSFVDTNVVVYAYDRSAGERHERARTLLQTLWTAGRGCLSVQVLQEFYVTVTRKVENPLASGEAVEIVRALSTWRVHAPVADDVVAAIQLHDQFKVSFWDALIIWSAMQLECKTVWSEDLNDKQLFGQGARLTQVRNPFG